LVAQHGAKGLAYMKVDETGALQSPILKFMTASWVETLRARSELQPGDMLFFGAGLARIVHPAMAALREALAKDFNLIKREWAPLWVVDFPMFAPLYADRGNAIIGWTSEHHPFTAPAIADPLGMIKDPGSCKSLGYDVVLNGFEIGGGSIRIDNEAMQRAVFELLGLSKEEQEKQFGFLLKGLRQGCPPHGGAALGVDRLLMLMVGASSIREVIAFPKTQSASCLLTGAPSMVPMQHMHDCGATWLQPPTPKSVGG
jgi:aspartyl-tRNA synthetase